MAKALLSSSLLPSLPRAVGVGAARLAPLPSLSRSGCRRAAGCRVRASLPGLDSVGGLHAALERAEAALYTLADAAVVAGAGGAGAGGADVEQAVQKSGGWFGFISDAMEVVLKMDTSEMNSSPAPSSGSFLDLLNTGSGDMNWGDTQNFSPIGEQVTTPIENIVASGKPKPSRKGVPKGKNWSSLEDKVLIESWANTSLDGVVGADQHSDSYWARITEYYNQHKNPAWQVRNVASVNGRYTTISSATSKFCGCLQQVLNRNQSGRTLDEKKEEAHLMFIQNDPNKKPFTFMHCYLEFVKYPKWELRELEVSQKKQKKKSDASPGVSAAAIIDDDLSVSSKMLEREEAPSGTKHEKEARKGKNPMSDGSSCKLSLQSVWAQKQEKDEMKEASKSARYAQVIELQKEKVALKKIDVELRQFEIDERVMLVDTSGMNILQKQFYEGKQKEIIARRQGM